MLVKILSHRKDSCKFSRNEMDKLLKEITEHINDDDIININYTCAYDVNGYYTHNHSLTVFYKEASKDILKKEF
jgi:effector-binding domain-containing protein